MKFICMLAEQGNEADLDSKDYLFEPKLDGLRAFLIKDKGIHLINRKGTNITKQFPELQLGGYLRAITCILDGEIVVFDQKGNPSLSEVMQRTHRLHGKKATFAAFDILEKDGKNLTHLPLEKRKQILKATVNENKHMQVVPSTDQGRKLWDLILKRKGEGVVAKAKGSIYEANISRAWLKIKGTKTVDCVIMGYIQKKRNLSSLALGLFIKGKLQFMGKVGTGFSESQLRNLISLLGALPKVSYPDVPSEIIGVEPRYVAEVKYFELTNDQKLRGPVFLRLRDDKDLTSCTFTQVIHG